MLNEFDWPKKGRKAFVPGEADASFYPKECQHFSNRAREFREAAETVLDRCSGENCRSGNDYLFFPIAYLYRHFLELRLKDIVSIGLRMRFFIQKDVEEAMMGHNLAKLWNHAKKLLLDRWSACDPTPVLAVEAIINEYHQNDPTGQMFRYELNTNGKLFRHDNLPDRICPDELRTTMNGVCNFLDATSGGLFDSLQAMLDAESQYATDY